MTESNLVRVPTKELVDLGAIDSILFCRTFLTKAFRQESPEFHKELFHDLDDPTARRVAHEVFRGGGKTTICRGFTLKRIAYAFSRTILFVSAAQDHSVRSVRWIKKQIELNKILCDTFQLRKGTKWTDEWIEIVHGIEECTINVVAAGITGQVRGLNIDDYRPDFIIVDDPCNEENTGTPDQRKKTRDLFFGSIENSLVSQEENPSAKIVLLQTSLDKEDLINTCHKDPTWRSRKYACFDEKGESRWPSQFSTKTLKENKAGALARGAEDFATWIREWECLTISTLNRAFNTLGLQYFRAKPNVPMVLLGAIDPVPPRLQGQKVVNIDTDFEVLTIAGYSNGKVYILDQSKNRGHEPDWTIMEFFRLHDQWKPLKWRVESVAYQRVLLWILRRAMQERKQYIQVDAVEDKRPKQIRIRQAFAGLIANKELWLPESFTELATSFSSYPDVAHDDDLDSAAMAVDGLINDPSMTDIIEASMIAEGTLEKMPDKWRSAP